MNPSPYELFKFVQTKGYIPPMAGVVVLDSINNGVNSPGSLSSNFKGTGDHMKEVMEVDRRNVFKAFYGEGQETESTWLAGEELGHGMKLPLWQERLIHADILVMQEKVDTTMDYLIHVLGQKKEIK